MSKGQKTVQSILCTPRQNTSQTHSNLSQYSENSVHKTLFMSDFYSCDPLHSSYSCFACLKRKKQNQSNLKVISKKPKRKLSLSKMDDIVIKPWHPFLRILQGFFRNDKGKIFDRYQIEDNKLIVEFISCLRTLRTSLISSQELILRLKNEVFEKDQKFLHENQKLVDSINNRIDENYNILNTNSLEIIEEFFNNSRLENPQPNKNNMRLQIVEQQLRNVQLRLRESEKTLEMVTGDIPPSLKSTIQQLIELQKQLGIKTRENEEFTQAEVLYHKEYKQLKEENYFIYELVRLERHTLFLNLMKQYPQELLQETEVSYFELYLQQLETQVSELRVSKARLTAQLKRSESSESNCRKEVEGVVANDQRRQKDQWGQERESYQLEIESLQNDLKRVERAEREITGTCMKIQNEREQLIQNTRLNQDQISQMNEVVLNLRNERDSLLQQLDMTQQSLRKIESQVVTDVSLQNIPQLQAQMQAGTAQAVQSLCHIILSKQQHLSSEQGEMIRNNFGESAPIVIDQYESALREQSKFFKGLENQIHQKQQEIENLQHKLSSYSLEIDRLNQLCLKLQEIDSKLEGIQPTIESHKFLTKITQEIRSKSTQEIQEIIQTKTPNNSIVKQKVNEMDGKLTIPTILFRTVNQFTQTKYETEDDLNMMVLMQAIAIEEMVKQAENKYEDEENFSDPPDSQDIGTHKQDFEVIMEQLNEEDEEEYRYKQSSDQK